MGFSGGMYNQLVIRPARGNVIGDNQRLAERFLIDNRMLGGGILLLYLVVNRVIHVEDLIARAKVILGIAMTVQAPSAFAGWQPETSGASDPRGRDRWRNRCPY